ncbi:glycosyltransferase family 2 protein [Empedobacter falsenii]
MNTHLISIIVPCYNQAQYLEECLQSVLDQTYQNWECIIVNDGSLDNTEEVAIRWVEKDTRFVYLKKENGGVASARNAGIDKAKGEWILPLDGDDKINSEYLAKAQLLFSSEVDLVYCNAVFFGEINEDWQLPLYDYSKLLSSNMIFCSAFYKKTSWKKVNGYDSNLIYGYEDWEFWISILDEESKVMKLVYNGFAYRRKNESRDVLVNNDISRKDISYNYIYKKHLSKYLRYNDNAIVNYRLINNKLHQLKKTNQQINKNIFTRFLFKLIKLIS